MVYNGIHDLKPSFQADAALKGALGISDQDLVFGTISRLDPIKNQSMMIRSFAQVNRKHSQAKLLMVGDGPIRAELESLVSELGLNENIIFTGFQVNPQRYLALMDIFLLSSLSEGTSMTLLEAMSFHKPCVVTDAGGNPEIVLHEETGLVSKNEDEAAFAESMMRLVEDESLRMKLGDTGRKRYEEYFSVSSMANQYEAIYEGLAG